MRYSCRESEALRTGVAVAGQQACRTFKGLRVEETYRSTAASPGVARKDFEMTTFIA